MSNLTVGLRGFALDLLDAATAAARRIVPADSGLRILLRRLRRRLPKRPLRIVPEIMQRLAKRRPEAFFIQVGANDGEQQDHLREAVEGGRWRGVLVEPVPYVFRRLRQRLGDNPRLALEQVAIADHDGVQTFHYLREAAPGEDLPNWYTAIGSFRRDVVLKHVWGIPDIEKRLVCEDVPCITFETLCRRHDIGAVDLIQIDTEGYDYEIVKLIDFARVRPTVLLYEHHHLSEPDRAACLTHLHGLGYITHAEVLDTLCIDARSSLGRELTDLLRRMKAIVPQAPAPEH